MSRIADLDPREVLEQMRIEATAIERVTPERRNRHWVVETKQGRIVLRANARDRSLDDVGYDLALTDHLHRRGWRVPVAVSQPLRAGGSVWIAFSYLGDGPSPDTPEDKRERGRLLARLHGDTAALASVLGQRRGWLRADQGLFDRAGLPAAEEMLKRFERTDAEAARLLLAYHECAQERLADLLPEVEERIVIHGDFAPWNLRVAPGEPVGIIDFDSAHLDLRVAEFALAWRGAHHEVVSGYREVFPLDSLHEALIVPVFWAWIVGSAVRGLDHSDLVTQDWAIKHLLRTPLDMEGVP